MEWLATALIGAVMGWLATVRVRANAELGMAGNALAGAIGSLTGAYCVTVAASGLPSAPLLAVVAIVSAMPALVFFRWVATPEPLRVRRRRHPGRTLHHAGRDSWCRDRR